MVHLLTTYPDGDVKEDVVMNAIEILTAAESQIFNMLGKTKAISTVHSYNTDTLRTAASQAVSEEADYTDLSLTTPTRLTNLVEIVALPFAVSRTEQQVEHYHGRNELERQTEKALREWGNAAEFDLVRGTVASGASGTTPNLSGIIEATSKAANHTTHTSTTAWDATILDGLMKNQYDNTNGDVATDLFMGSFLRDKTDKFTAKSNIVVNGSITGIVKTVSTYTTAFGTINLHTHRYIQQSTDAHGRVLAINPAKLKIAMLQAPFIDTGLARSGDYDKRAVVGKFTLEVRNQDTNFYADGLINA